MTNEPAFDGGGDAPGGRAGEEPALAESPAPHPSSPARAMNPQRLRTPFHVRVRRQQGLLLFTTTSVRPTACWAALLQSEAA
jgi:hypothetical protein